MEPDFWHQRWAQDQIGFHLSEVNPWLRQFWPVIQAKSQARVLVPLCGKSLDLAWLASEGHAVLGVELSHKAVEEFFKGQGVEPIVRQQGRFTVYRHDSIELWCGDFFALTADDAQHCSALYDRAALIALPPHMRQRYTEHLARILPGDCQGLLTTLDYDQYHWGAIVVGAGPGRASASGAWLGRELA